MTGVITLIEEQKKGGRCNIYLDGKFFCGLNLEVVIKSGLKVGDSVDRGVLCHLQLDSEKGQALDKAMTYLTASAKTEKQVRDFLLKKGYTYMVLDYVIEKLREYNFVNDSEYCKNYVDSVGEMRGKRKVALDLKRKGIGDESISEAMQNMPDQTEACLTALQKYMRNKQPDRETTAKAFRHLVSKGFDFDTVKRAMNKNKFDIEDDNV